MKSEPLIISTGAGESPTDLASLLVPTATTSSISSAAETKEGTVGRINRERATAIPLIRVLNILFTPKLIKNITSIKKRNRRYVTF